MDKIERGDEVERIVGNNKCRRGRVTGFAPNGRARVLLENNQSRIWDTMDLRITRKAECLAPLPPPRVGRPMHVAPHLIKGGYRVIEVFPEQDRFNVIGHFWRRSDAQGCANEAWATKSFRFIYDDDGYRGGISWRLCDNETWRQAQDVADRAFAFANGQSIDKGQ